MRFNFVAFTVEDHLTAKLDSHEFDLKLQTKFIHVYGPAEFNSCKIVKLKVL